MNDMKYIEKMSVVPIPPASGAVSDTINIEDKVTNAPSINLVQQMTGIPQDGIITYDGEVVPEGYEEVKLVEDLSESIVLNSNIDKTTSHIQLLKYGQTINLLFTIIRTNNWNTTDTILTIPSEISPKISFFVPVFASGNNFNAVQIKNTGTINVGISNNSNWISGNITWTIE